MDSEELPDLSDWVLVEAWTLEEAAMLWAAIDPFDHIGVRIHDLGREVSFARRRKALIFQRAAMEAVCAGTLPFVAARELCEHNGESWERVIHPQELPDRDAVLPHKTVVKQAAFRKWAYDKRMPSYRMLQAKTANSPVLTAPTTALPRPVLPDLSHPRAPVELIVGLEVWEEISGPDYIDGVSPNPKQVALKAIENHPLGKDLSVAAKDRLSTSANWKQKGGCNPTPGE